MSFRVVLIENSAELRYKLDNLMVVIEGKETWIPFSDISTIVVDSLNISISSRVYILVRESRSSGVA